MERHSRVLVVEDEPDLRWLIKQALEPEFAAITVAGYDGAAFVLYTVRIDAVLTDLQLEETRTGMDVLATALLLDPACGRVLMSGCPAQHVVDAALATGLAHGFLPKPWRSHELQRTLRHAMAQSGQETVQRGGPAQRSL